MNRCVVIHRNGTSEVEDVQPAVHQKLRGLDYKRFVVEFVRDKDGVSYRSALYSKLTPSTWQVGDAVRKLWGRHTGAIRVFDENGDLLPESSDGATAVPPPVTEPRSSDDEWASSVEPALSVDDWRAWSETSSVVLPGGTDVDRTKDGGIGVTSAPNAWGQIRPDDRAAVAALLNSALPDGEPHKLTREHAVALRHATRVLESSRALDAESLSRLRGLADLLESYVMPDKP
jgi:hypothetical protein